MTDPYIPDRFRQTVALHMMRCFTMDKVSGTGQILVIDGPPGSGKTFQLTRTLNDCAVELTHFGAAEVESASANRPVEDLHHRLNDVRAALEYGRPAALVMDDADLLLGRLDDTQYTHNLQHLVMELMRVAGATSLTNAEPRPLPIFMLTNNIDVLHAPLLRNGRATLYRWAPNPQEMTEIILRIFDGLEPEAAVQLLAAFPGATPAFFSSILARVVDQYYLRLIQDGDMARLLRWALLHASSVRPTLTFSVDQLVRVGRTLTADRTGPPTPAVPIAEIAS